MNRPAEEYLPQALERGWTGRLATKDDIRFTCDYCGEPIEAHSMLVEDPGGFCFHRKSCAEKAAEGDAEQQAYNRAQP